MNITAQFSSVPENYEIKAESTYKFLSEKGISFSGVSHSPADTMEICREIENTLGAEICKNLFLCTSNKSSYYLLLMPGNKIFKTKFLSKQINSSRLSFAGKADMEKYLGVTPGSVSIMGLLNDTENKVNLLIDKELLDLEFIGFHPCINTSTVKISTEDFLNVVIPAIKGFYTVVDLPKFIPEDSEKQ